ncbi:MAG: PAS domain S-box protein [Okeania sp. SIO3I5]|uniref:PAS domain S-box protein n=1 Tax=Okeania sp. SIO3I5 TaxID=2607805 RepID=UPI0013B6BD38|nr:PAS domain S-box protein [Okeania sp. SIO3I5]NEQ35761.1 PAS domain S-box protein [Okeania sp. SIO3I5]
MSDYLLPSIPGYTLTAQLYAGSSSAVYRAISDRHGESVVIKILISPYPNFTKLVRFRNQYIIAKNLDIPSLVKPLAFLAWDCHYALVMEDVEAIDLQHYVEAHDRLTVEKVLAIALQLADSLHHLGQHRVLHKDIKPTNILIHPNTHQIWLIDFSLASLLPKESLKLQSPSALEGTLAYIAPEQTGRMNRGIDYRADFYSLGVTLYELLTGERPFQSDDPMELIHSHIAKMPVPPWEFSIYSSTSTLTYPIPKSLSDIVLKLMAKNAEDRYQSALGLKHDLQRCLELWTERGTVVEFELGQEDRCDRFLIPDKLYGRETEVQTLLDAFERVASPPTPNPPPSSIPPNPPLKGGGRAELILVAGFSGVGKTAVVNEVHKPITRQKGYFIKGKFDQFNRNIPFSAFVQALRSLIRQLLSESDVALANWKVKILAAVAGQGQVLIEVIPELALIIGSQPAVSELSGIAAQNRFNLLFGKFIQIFTTQDHPLAIFLDDLQWADSASLNLLKLLISGAETGHLLVLGAYRDNEVSPIHPLILTLDELRQHLTKFDTLTLASLKQNDIHQLVADSLHCSVEIATPLAELVYQKTQGNPFFATQFLHSLQADGWITFNADVGYWQCDFSQIRLLALTDDVVEFMVRRLQQWPETTQNALAIAACLGNEFKLDTLGVVCEQSSEELASELWPALQAGLIVPENENYKFFQGIDDLPTTTQLTTLHDVTVTYRFLHDRVQQAAYTFIPEQQRQQTHYQIGRFLLDQIPQEKQEEHIFDIVNQLNIGRDIISSAAEQHQLRVLNWRAGIKAKSATAYAAALKYFDIAIETLSEAGWQQYYPLALNIHENAAEAAYLAGNSIRMEAIVQTVTTQAQTCLDTVKTLQVKMQFCLGQNQPLASIEIARNLLKELGVVLPESPSMEDVKQELETFKQFSARFSFDEIVALPVLTDPEKLAIVSTLILVVTPIMIVDPNLFFLVVLITTRFSLEYGNPPSAPYGYALYAILIKNLEQNIDTAYEWGSLAIRLLQTANPKILENRAYHAISAFITHEKSHIEETLNVFQQAYNNGLENGDFEFASYSIYIRCYSLYFLGWELSAVKQAIVKTTEALSSIGQNLPISWSECLYQTVIELLGTEDDSHQVAGNAFDVDTYVQSKQEQGDIFGLCYFYLNQATLLYVLGDYPQALDASESAEQYLAGPAGMLVEVVFYFYDSLIRLACAHGLDNANWLAKVSKNQEKMKRWADNAPMNFQHKYDLVCAEEQRLLGDRLAAMDYYDLAIAGAKENKYLQEEALANELAARFYLDWGKEKIAAVYLQEAYLCYNRWGAKAKTDNMEACYSDLLQPILQQTNAIDPVATLHSIAPLHLSIHSSGSSAQTSTGSINTAFDLTTIFKSAQALSESIDLSELLEKLTPMMLQTSGAERLVLLLPDADNTWQVRVTATAETTELISVPLKENIHLPIQLIQYVQRTEEILAIDGLDQSLPIVDPYLQQNPHRSVLCLPLVHQTKLIGLLYLEHHSVAGVFSHDRITILNFLCNQAAISLENALLNQALGQKLEIQTAKRQESEAHFRNMVNNVPGVVYQGRFNADGTFSFLYVSPDCYDLYEISAEAIISGQYSFRDFEHSEDRPLIDQMLAEISQTLQPFNYEFRIFTASGKLKWVHAISHCRNPMSDGSILWDGIVMDVSERKEAEIALQEAQARFCRMTENVPGMIYRYILHGDGSDELTYVSSQVQDIFELEPEIALQDMAQVWARLHPDDIPRLGEAIQESAQTLQSFTSNYRLILPNKGIRWVQNMTSVDRMDNGDVVWNGIVVDISERKQAEDQLKVLSQRLELVLESAEIGIWEWNKTDNHLIWDKRMFCLYGVAPEDFSGRYEDWVQRLHPDDLERMLQQEAQMLHEQVSLTTEFKIIRPDNQVRHIYSNVISQRNQQGDLVKMIGLNIDLTDRKTAELALEGSKRRYASLAAAAPVVIYRLDKPLHISYINERWSEMTGRQPEAALGYGWMDALHPDDREQFVANWSKVYSLEGLPDQFFMHGSEGRYLRLDGSVNWFYSRLAREFDDDGNVVGYIGTLTDITERKKAELALQDAQARFRRMTENVPGMIFRYIRYADGHDELTYVSSQVRELFEVEPEIALQNTLWNRIHPDDVPIMSQETQVAAETLEASTIPYRLILPKKGIRWVQNMSSVERLDNGDVVWDGIVVDITDRKQAEEQLKALSTRLELALKSAEIGIWEWNFQDSRLSWDDRMFEIYGISPDMFEGTYQDWEKYVHPDDLEQAKMWKEDENPVFREFRVIRADGLIRYVASTVLRQYDDRGQPIRAVGTNIDITPHKATELAFAESERRYASLAAAAPVAIFRMDQPMNCTYVNDRWGEMTGRPLEAAMGRGWMDTLHPDDLENRIAAWTEIYPNLPPGSPVLPGAEGRCLRPDGTIRWYYVQIAQEWDYNGNVVGYVGTLTDITERKKAELALQDAQARFRRMTENVPGMIFRYVIHPNGSDKLTYVSSQVRDIFELEPETLLKDTTQLWARIHPDDIPWLQDSIQSSAETLQPFQVENRLILPEKGLRWVQIISRPERLENGDTLWDGVVIDISDRKTAEKSLKLTQFAVDKTGLGIFWIREDGLILEVNEAACSDLGYSYEELKGSHVWDFNPEFTPQEWIIHWEKIRQSSFLRFEVKHQHKDGHIFPVEIVSNYIEYDGQGFLYAQVQDISDRKQAELALEQEVLRRNTIFNTSSDGIHILDIEGNLIEGNASFYRMLGYTQEEARHLNVGDWDAKFPLKQIQADFKRHFLNNTQVRTVETLHRRKDGSVFPVQITICSMTWDGKVSFVCIARDISEWKQAEAQLQRTNEELVRATRLKDEFLANMSHELRTPLNTILGLSEALQDTVFGPLTEKQIKYLKTIQKSGTHLLELINDILDVSKIESGQLELDLKATNIRSLCESSMTFVKQQALKKQISLKTNLPPDSLSLVIDERRILQSLVNLLNNAVKFTPEGGYVALEVSCDHQDENWKTLDSQEQSEEVENPNKLVWQSGALMARNYIKISVSDTGIGISPEHITKLFKPFSQIDTALNRKYNGTGLGLVLVKQMTELHGGTVSLTSEVGVGSCFSINIPYDSVSPLVEADSSSDDINQPSLPISVQGEDSRLILLAEDNEDTVSVIVPYLENSGYRLILAKNGLEAIALAQTHRPDLILMDIQMPELDGLESMQRIRQDSHLKHIPIVVLTALAMSGDRERCLGAGANLYFSKPVNLRQLVLSLQTLLAQ